MDVCSDPSSHLQLSSLWATRSSSVDCLLLTSTLCVALKAHNPQHLCHAPHTLSAYLPVPKCVCVGGVMPLLLLSLPFPSHQPKSHLPILLAQFTKYLRHETFSKPER